MVNVLPTMLCCLLVAIVAPATAAQRAPDAAGPDAGALALTQVMGVRITPEIERLAVTWLRVRGATGYKVQWRWGSRTYRNGRERITQDTNYTIRRLVGDRTYHVRVIAIASGVVDGMPSDEVSARPFPVPPNMPPMAVGTVPALRLDVDESATVSMLRYFDDPNDSDLFYTVRSAAEAIATAEVRNGVVTVTGRGHGETALTVTAIDRDGLSGTQTFEVAVGNLLELEQGRNYVLVEGRSLTVAATLSKERAAATVVTYAIGADADAETADADADDFAQGPRVATIAAGARETVLTIPIVDDDEIEPLRETFTVTLQDATGSDYAVRPSKRKITARIDEGVCDRTPAVRDELRSWRSCEAVDAGFLALRQTLDLRRRRIDTLKGADFADLDQLRVLLLSDNQLQALPPGLFAGLENLRQLHLQDNPGAPFALAVGLARTNAPLQAPPPAWVTARVVEAAPFPMTVELAAVGGTLTRRRVTVPTGATSASRSSLVRRLHSVVRVSVATPPRMPTSRCGGVLCYQGIETVAGARLALFKEPPRATALVAGQRLEMAGDSLRLDLAPLFATASADTLVYRATSSDPALATATIAGNSLVLTANDDGAEGNLTIAVTATDADGLSAEITFQVTVALIARTFLRGWRTTLALPRSPHGDGSE